MTVRGVFGALAMAALFALPSSTFADGPESVAKLAAQLSPAVVNIGTTRHYSGTSGEPYPQGPDGTPLDDMLENLNPNQGQGPEALQEAQSLGSGFIINADGTIVTNNHVIDGADEIQVFLTDGTRWPAKVIGADPKVDLAVLKIDAGHPLPFVEFGDSDTAEVGDWVMAIGNPFGLGGSVTLGIVSARNRDIESGPYDEFIQTDAAINQGNSGGPLFDMDGKVVGINSAIIARSGASVGIGFAVPVNLARPVVEQLAEFGETRRGWLGVGIQDVTQDIAASLGLPDTHGALAVNITKDSPADGLIEEGDLILEFDGKPIIAMRDLPRIVAETPVGKLVTVKVRRKGADLTVPVTLGRLETGELLMAQQNQQLPDGGQPDPDPELPSGPPPSLSDLVGLDVGPIDDASRKNFGIRAETRGLLITSVKPGSDAERQGLIEGLVISEVNQQETSTVAEFREKVDAAKEAGRPTVLFKVTDPTGQSRFIPVQIN
ncbi:MAG: Do family serine endopeptidase [Devosia sp.]